MKKIVLGVFVLLLSLTLIACFNDTTENLGEEIDFSVTRSKPQQITVWIDDEQGDYMKDIITEFNKIYPNIVVTHQHKGSVDAREHLKTFGPSGNGADVFQFPHDHLASAVLEDLVYRLPAATQTTVSARAHELGLGIATLSYDEQNKSFDPNSPNALESLFAVPMSIESLGLYYNKDLIQGEVPTTYEALFAEVDAWNAAIASDGSGLTNAAKGYYGYGTSSQWGDAYFNQHIFSAFDWTPFGPQLNDPSSVGFEKTQMTSALNWMVNELKPRVTGTGNTDSATAGAHFEAGRIPYILAGPWNIEAYTKAGIDFGIAPLPSINGEETAPYAGAIMAAVYKYTPDDRRDAAIKFVEFLTTDIAMSIQYEYKGKLPALKNELLANIAGVNENPHMLAIAQQLESAVPMPTIPEVQYFWGPAETMVKDVWNSAVDFTTAQRTAEESFEALRSS